MNRSLSYHSVLLHGGYAVISYVLTGESRFYVFSEGYFYGLRNIRQSWGALQLLGRISCLNLNDEDVRGGKETNFSVGLNWYPRTNVRVNLTYTHANMDPNFLGVKQIANIIGYRVEILFF